MVRVLCRVGGADLYIDVLQGAASPAPELSKPAHHRLKRAGLSLQPPIPGLHTLRFSRFPRIHTSMLLCALHRLLSLSIPPLSSLAAPNPSTAPSIFPSRPCLCCSFCLLNAPCYSAKHRTEQASTGLF